MLVSALARVEVAAALWRKHRTGEIGSGAPETLLAEFEADLGGTEDELPRFTVVRVTTSVLEDAAQLVVRHPLRAYDAVQLATAAAARTADPRCSTFACFDARLSAAASGEKFELLSV